MSDIDRIQVPGPLGPYRLLRRLGHGGTSQVFLAESYGASGFEKRVAIKTLLPQYLGDPRYERLFIREARLGANLVHRNLVQIHDFGIDDGIQYMRLDWIDGADLAVYRGDRALKLPAALHIAGEIAAALEYLHAATDTDDRPLGLVHRDLKPSNVLISRSGEVLLSDFGIVKATSRAEVTRGDVRRGSYCYMSPEQVRGRELTHASDQFALGCILAELLLGRRLFEADTVSEVGEAIVSGEVSLEEVPGAVQGVLGRLLSVDPAQRFPTPSETVDTLRALKAKHPFVDRLALPTDATT